MIALCFSLFAPASAGESPMPVRPTTPTVVEFRQRVYSRDQGLPENRVLSLLQSRDGYLWVGTASGVARFDGVKFHLFNPDSHREFVNDECAALAEGLDGAIWIGTKNGLLRLKDGRIRRFTEQEGLADKRIHALCVARNGDVWIGTSRGLNRLRQGRMESIPMPRGKKEENQQVTAVYEDASGAVWIASVAGTRRWELQSDQLHEVTLPDAEYAILISGDGQTNVWTKGARLFRWQEGWSDELVDHAGGAALLVSRDGSVWFNRELGPDEHAGFFRFRDGKLAYYDLQDGLSDERVTSLLEDQQDNLWIGTHAGGLNCWQPRRFPTLGRAEGLAPEKVWTLAPARDGGIWIGTDEGIRLWREGRIEPSPILTRLTRRAARHGKGGDASASVIRGVIDGERDWRRTQPN